MVGWDYYKGFDEVMDRYLPAEGEGDTLATQTVTAVTKLIYKWYNDGDVFDNVNSPMEGWVNDLSSYANWLDKNIPKAGRILYGIMDCYNDDDYEDLLRELADATLDMEDLEHLDECPAVGSIYKCDGPYEFNECFDEDEDDEW